MGKSWLTAALLLFFSCTCLGQDQRVPEEPAAPGNEIEGSREMQEISASAADGKAPDGKAQPALEESGEDQPIVAAVPEPKTGIEPISNLRPLDYRRPDARTRFNNYVNNIAGPDALLQYAGTAALLTWRNSPKEWGAKPSGMARRLANTAAKNLIKESVIYGLDEALKVDSSFYLSRDRSVAARLRNSVFSAVTARNRRGHRVIGIPRLAGSFASGVIASTQWYPGRYDHDHGLKGGAIAIGVTAGVNLSREFVLKR